MDIMATEAMRSAWKMGAEHLKVYSSENLACLLATRLASLKHIRIWIPNVSA